MKTITKSIVIASVFTLAFGAFLLPAKVMAWHPDGKIVKYVANETTGSQSVDANSANEAVDAKPGDALNYTITVRNDGKPASNGWNDLAFVEITDTLPAGVELVSNPAQRTIKETIPGIIKPGASVTKTYKVRVTSNTDGDLLKNRACFTGDSTVKDNKQKGCDDAYTKVHVKKEEPQPEPPKPEEPKEEPKEQVKEEPKVLPAVLPSTGPGAVIGSFVGLGTLSYAIVNYRRSKKALVDALKK